MNLQKWYDGMNWDQRKSEIQSIVADFRKELRIPTNEIIKDIVSVVKKAGYRYYCDSFGDNFAGYSQYVCGITFVIGYNSSYDSRGENFKRFTISHELGHVTIPEHRKKLIETGLHQSMIEPSVVSEIEREADYFSINLLTPTAVFEKDANSNAFDPKSAKLLSDKYKISPLAAAYRFVELTELSCSLIVCNANGVIIRDSRSSLFYKTFHHASIKGIKIKKSLLKQKSAKSPNVLGEFYPKVSSDVNVNVITLKQPYNKTFVLFLNPVTL